MLLLLLSLNATVSSLCWLPCSLLLGVIDADRDAVVLLQGKIVVQVCLRLRHVPCS
jgi:hypothetical protein